ncbi:MAG TPA: heme exporter protein CcmD [Stellaceae bacterium]|nr:heme exporter protein CcmD [Stellaceae bacterium]
MTDQMAHFLAMGGYAIYVWPAYGVATAVLGFLVVQSVLAYRRTQREFTALERRRR